jgi:hypothetical protein
VVRKVQLADVRVGPRGEVRAAPCWAYRHSRFGCRKPIAAAWRDLLPVLQARADAIYERQLASGHRLRTWWGRRLGRPEVCPPSTSNRRTCRACGGEFFAAEEHIRLCSPACQKAWRARRPRPSRAKQRQTVPCTHCGREFLQTRQDARFCSVRCRVAAHRREHAGR